VNTEEHFIPMVMAMLETFAGDPEAMARLIHDMTKEAYDDGYAEAREDQATLAALEASLDD